MLLFAKRFRREDTAAAAAAAGLNMLVERKQNARRAHLIAFECRDNEVLRLFPRTRRKSYTLIRTVSDRETRGQIIIIIIIARGKTDMSFTRKTRKNPA